MTREEGGDISTGVRGRVEVDGAAAVITRDIDLLLLSFSTFVHLFAHLLEVV